jgi:hypothetical protein
MITVEVRTDGRIPRRDLAAARRAMAHLLADGMVLYLRRDGDYGPVEAAWPAG